jgi:hypothetical protein
MHSSPPRRKSGKRRFLSQTAVSVSPLAISQHTAAAHGFKTERQFLEWVVSDKVAHWKRGQTVFVAADVVLDQFRETEKPTSQVEPIDEADRVLASIGRRRAG